MGMINRNVARLLMRGVFSHTAQCHFDRRIAAFTNINPATTYSFRVRGRTIIGDGYNIIEPTCTLGYTGPAGACSCNTGYTGPIGDPCTACVAGKYKSAIGSAACTDCGPGKYSSTLTANAAEVCLTCPTGSTSPVATTSSAVCIVSVDCNAGYTGPSGGPCTECVAGK